MSVLLLLSGPSGVGKGTLVSHVTQAHPEIWVSVSATTRSPRPGEVDGRDYVFLTEEEFAHMREHGELLEWATVHGQFHYGTPRGPVEERVNRGIPCILEIDYQGMRQVKKVIPEAVSVFIAPPSWEELVSRLEGRGSEDALQRERRLETARRELDLSAEFDHVVVNDDLAVASQRLHEILRAGR